VCVAVPWTLNRECGHTAVNTRSNTTVRFVDLAIARTTGFAVARAVCRKHPIAIDWSRKTAPWWIR
jgi:hypothetical protein